MIIESVFPTPPPTEGILLAQADAPVTDDKPVSSEPEPNTTPEAEPPLGGSEANEDGDRYKESDDAHRDLLR